MWVTRKTRAITRGVIVDGERGGFVARPPRVPAPFRKGEARPPAATLSSEVSPQVPGSGHEPLSPTSPVLVQTRLPNESRVRVTIPMSTSP